MGEISEDTYLTGWRAWTVREDEGQLFLQGLYKPRELWWPGKKVEATCPLTRGALFWKRSLHSEKAPALNCVCGFHTLQNAVDANDYIDDWYDYIKRQHKYRRRHILYEKYGTSSPVPVLGTVNMWGRTADHRAGTRAQYAYPAHLYISVEEWQERADAVAKILQDQYWIPVDIIPTRSSISLQLSVHPE